MNTAIILASGTGIRFQGDTPKQFIKLAGLPVLVHTLKTFQSHSLIDKIIVVTGFEYINQVWGYANTYELNKVCKVVVGGATRQESSRIGIECCAPETEYVLIHDGVRPLLSEIIISNVISAVKKFKAIDTVIPSADTIVVVDKNNYIESIPDRTFLKRGQTPQAFSYNLIQQAHKLASENDISNSTDDCALVMKLGHSVYTVMGDEQNIKVTYPIDLHIADKLFQLKCHVSDERLTDDMLKQFSDKVFLIIGGTSGIGKSLAEILKPHARSVYALGRSTAPAIDITDSDSIEHVLQTIYSREGHIDYLINCAGDLIRKNVEFTSIDEWDYIYDVNVKGNFLIAKSIIPYLKKQHSGNIMFVGSSSYTRGRSGYAAYCSSKAALVNFCQSLAEELAPNNIRVNIISPSRVNTPLRFRNFGNEDPSTLLNPDTVAEKTVLAMLHETTGSIFEIN